MNKKFDVQRYLDDLKNRIDPAVEADLLAQWRRFLTDGDMEKVFAGTVDMGVRIFSLDPAAVRQTQEKHRQLHGLVHVSS